EWLMAEHGVTDYEAYFKFVHPEGEESALEPDPVLKQFLNELPYSKYILTNAPIEHAERILAKLDCTDCFAGIFDIRFNNLKGKPHHEAYQHVADTLQVSIQDILFIDDIPRYVQGFTNLGGKGLLIDQLNKHQQYPFAKITQLQELVHYL
ncbi:MAG TPA: HAD-IA family hydrolase, partial [Spirochaetia bacterium]|nr:HAD-IA family hydrolase [Spirochaetia bacterium]